MHASLSRRLTLFDALFGVGRRVNQGTRPTRCQVQARAQGTTPGALWPRPVTTTVQLDLNPKIRAIYDMANTQYMNARAFQRHSAVQ